MHRGPIMHINFFIGISGNPLGADNSVLGAINRPLWPLCSAFAIRSRLVACIQLFHTPDPLLVLTDSITYFVPATSEKLCFSLSIPDMINNIIGIITDKQ